MSLKKLSDASKNSRVSSLEMEHSYRSGLFIGGPWITSYLTAESWDQCLHLLKKMHPIAFKVISVLLVWI